MKLFDRLKVDGDDDEADKGGTITVGIFWNVTIARRKEGIGRRIRFLDGGLTEEKKIRLSGIRRSDERKQEEDMDAAIEVDLKLRDRRRWMNVYTKSNHNPQLSNKAMNLAHQGFSYIEAKELKRETLVLITMRQNRRFTFSRLFLRKIAYPKMILRKS